MDFLQVLSWPIRFLPDSTDLSALITVRAEYEPTTLSSSSKTPYHYAVALF